MPLTAKGEKIKRNMEQEYGTEKGKQVFYASQNKGTIKGTHEKGASMNKFAEGFMLRMQAQGIPEATAVSLLKIAMLTNHAESSPEFAEGVANVLNKRAISMAELEGIAAPVAAPVAAAATKVVPGLMGKLGPLFSELVSPGGALRAGAQTWAGGAGRAGLLGAAGVGAYNLGAKGVSAAREALRPETSGIGEAVQNAWHGLTPGQQTGAAIAGIGIPTAALGYLVHKALTKPRHTEEEAAAQ